MGTTNKEWGPPTKNGDHKGMGTPVGFLASLARGDVTGSVNEDHQRRIGTNVEWGPLWDFWRAWPEVMGTGSLMGTTNKERGPLWDFWRSWTEVMGIGSVNGDHQQRMGTTCGLGTLVGFLASLARGDGDRLSKWGPPTTPPWDTTTIRDSLVVPWVTGSNPGGC